MKFFNFYNDLICFLKNIKKNFSSGVKFLFESAGILAFILYIYEASIGNLRIDIDVKEERDSILLETSVINENTFGKEIDYAIVFIAKYGFNNCELNRLINLNIEESKGNIENCSLSGLKMITNQALYKDSIALIPIPFYYNEQTNIGNENISYTVKVDKENLVKGTYTARFYIFYKNWVEWNRVTQDIFFLE